MNWVIWGFFPTDPGELVEAFAVRDLTLTGAYMGFRFGDTGVHNAAQEEAVKVARHMATVADRLGSQFDRSLCSLMITAPTPFEPNMPVVSRRR